MSVVLGELLGGYEREAKRTEQAHIRLCTTDNSYGDD
jgi:hypothetical protein